MSARFALVKSREAMRRDFLPPEKRPAAYGYPARRSPAPYRGPGREERDLYDVLSPDAPAEAEELIEKLEDGDVSPSEVFSSLARTRLFADAFDDAEDYEILYLVPEDEKSDAPAELSLIGYDVCYPPDEELFSAVSDLFYYPLWRGADSSGREFAREYALLNSCGLFSDEKSARDFLAHYREYFKDDCLLPVAVYAETI